MWGTPHRVDEAARLGRFIPTHVGNTPALAAPIPRSPVHPHACGEHQVVVVAVLAQTGSSPRMWGTRRRAETRPAEPRFIPTHVGNTNRAPRTHAPFPVHPHACGEHFRASWFAEIEPGSSPRMWGTLTIRGRVPGCVRFIPTHVGNTYRFGGRSLDPSVHPHACGEHKKLVPTALGVAGSSPRMWGTHLPYNIVFKEEKTPRKIYRLILYSVVRSRGWNATNCSPSNNTGCRRLTPRVWNS